MTAKFALYGMIAIATALYISSELHDARRAAQPATNWLDVRSVSIADAVEGESPRLDVDRIIRRDFSARWSVDVRSIDPKSGATRVVCSAQGISRYLPNSEPIIGRDLDWWTSPRRCRPEPGRYRVDALWMIHTENGERLVASPPAEFNVVPRPSPG